MRKENPLYEMGFLVKWGEILLGSYINLFLPHQPFLVKYGMSSSAGCTESGKLTSSSTRSCVFSALVSALLASMFSDRLLGLMVEVVNLSHVEQ